MIKRCLSSLKQAELTWKLYKFCQNVSILPFTRHCPLTVNSYVIVNLTDLAIGFPTYWTQALGNGVIELEIWLGPIFKVARVQPPPPPPTTPLKKISLPDSFFFMGGGLCTRATIKVEMGNTVRHLTFLLDHWCQVLLTLSLDYSFTGNKT